MFTDEKLNDVWKVDPYLRGHCNTGVYHADEKDLCDSIFDMWLVCNRTDNLIFLPRLENDRFCVIYENLKSWAIHFPNVLIYTEIQYGINAMIS